MFDVNFVPVGTGTHPLDCYCDKCIPNGYTEAELTWDCKVAGHCNCWFASEGSAKCCDCGAGGYWVLANPGR